MFASCFFLLEFEPVPTMWFFFLFHFIVKKSFIISKLFIHVADIEMKDVIGGENGAGTPRLAIQSEPYVSFDIQSNLY